jgi:dienelactone hydrolase
MLVACGIAVPASATAPAGSPERGTPPEPCARPPMPTRKSEIRGYRACVLEDLKSVMGELPNGSRRVPLDVRIVRVDSLPRCVRTTLTFATEPGDRGWACLLVPRGLRRRAPAVLCAHQATPLGKSEPAGIAGSPDMFYALELAERGYVTLTLDYPNTGDYRVDVEALGYASTTMKNIWNGIRAVDLLESLPEVDPRRIGALGHSMGGLNVLFSAVFDPRLRVVVTNCGFTALSRYADGDLRKWSLPQYMPRIGERYGNDAARVPFDFPEVLAVLAPRPVLVLAAEKDGIFDVRGVRESVAGAAGEYRLTGAKHRLEAVYYAGYHHFPRPARLIAYGWLDRWLKG